MYTPYGLLIQLGIFILIVIAIIVWVYRSPLEKDKKLVATIVTAIMPVMGLIVFLIFMKHHRRHSTQQ
jgi:hypothetical protein